MSNPLEEQLLGHLLGALDPSEEEQLAARLQTDPQVRKELARIQRRLKLLEPGRYDSVPPRGLAGRTCKAVWRQAGRAPGAERQPMSPATTAHGPGGRFRWIDLAVAAAVLATASLMTVPAIQSSRFNAQLLGCQDNLRLIGVGMWQYSQQHDGYFPSIPAQGELAAAGLYAPILIRDGLVPDGRRFVCPASSLAGQQGFRVPSFDELQTASRERLGELVRRMGGSYGYHLGYVQDGVLQGTRNMGRADFGVVADSPGTDPSKGRQSLNHGGRGQNVLLECLSVRFITSPRPNPQADDIYANDWGLVAPGLHSNDSVIGSSATRPFLMLISH